MARYTQDTKSTNNNTTSFEDRMEYAQKWADHYFSIKAIIKDNNYTKESEVVKHLAEEWEAKANKQEDRAL